MTLPHIISSHWYLTAMLHPEILNNVYNFLFFDDVDYSEEVEYLISEPPSNQEIKSYLTELSTDILRNGNINTNI